MESLIGVLPFLVLLACPLMMVVCFWSMRRMGPDTDEAKGAAQPATATMDQNLPVAEQIAVLQHRLDQLQTEQSVIGAQLAELAEMETAQDAPVREQAQLHPATPDGALASLDS